MLVSPGALDMAGLLVVPREKDFRRMDADMAKEIIQECGISRDEELATVMRFKGGNFGARSQEDALKSLIWGKKSASE
jgi:hypothetical protein